MATKKTPSASLKANTGTASTSVALKKPTNNIVAIQDLLKQQGLATLDQIGSIGGPTISLSKSGFSLPDGTTVPGSMDVVIVDFISGNTFYDRKYDAKDPCPPACFARSPQPKGLIPSDNSPNRQCDTCDGCPMNEFGSSPTGKGKACTNNRLLAVLPPDADESTPIWILKVSPTALRGFDAYVAGVFRTFGVPPMGVVTTVSLNTATDFPQLIFGTPVLNENVGVHMGRKEEARELLMAEPDTSRYQPLSTQRNASPARKAVRGR